MVGLSPCLGPVATRRQGRPQIRREVWRGEVRLSKLRFGAGVEGGGPRVEGSVALSGWLKGSREVNVKPVKQLKVCLALMLTVV